MTDPKSGLVLGIDLGTTNYKAMLYDVEGRQAGLGSVAPQYITSDDGRVELPVAQCVDLIQGAIAGAVATAATSTEHIKAIAYSSQANTFLLLDADMQPLTPFIIWTDHREKTFPPAYQQLARQPEFLNTVGFSSIAPGMMVANIAWFQREQPKVWKAARRIMSLPDYFVYLLTGKAVGDSGSGALMGLWDLHRNEWWPKAVQAANIPLEYLPEFDYPGTVVGCTNPAGSRLFELPEGIPVAVGSLDHHVAAIGAGAGRIAPFSISMGTVIAATCLDDNFAVDPKCCLGPGMHGQGWYRLAWHNHGTRAINWYRDNFAPEHSVSELLAMAEKVPSGISLPALALCPWDLHWPQGKHLAFSDNHASADHGIYVQSILAGIADLLKDMLNTLQPDLVKQGIVVTGGGARCDSWMRMISERIGAPVFRSSSEQAGFLGSAVLASVAAGWYSRIDEASAAMVGECVTL